MSDKTDNTSAGRLPDRVRKFRAVIGALLFCVAGSAPASLRADTLVLKSGRTYRNVKVVPRKTAQLIVFQTGRVLRVENSRVKRVDINPVRWQRGGISKARVDEIVRAAVEKETERVRRETRRDTRAKISRESRAARAARLREWSEDGTGRLWRSALIPGWGQYRAGATTQAMLFFAGSAALFGNYWTRRAAHGRAQDEMDDRTVPILMPFLGTTGIIAGFAIREELRRELFKLESSTNKAAVLLGAFYAWNLADAYFLAGRPGTGRLSVSPTPDSIQFRWSIALW